MLSIILEANLNNDYACTSNAVVELKRTSFFLILIHIEIHCMYVIIITKMVFWDRNGNLVAALIFTTWISIERTKDYAITHMWYPVGVLIHRKRYHLSPWSFTPKLNASAIGKQLYVNSILPFYFYHGHLKLLWKELDTRVVHLFRHNNRYSK